MTEQGRVDLERLRDDWTLPNGKPAAWAKLYRHEAEALLAVVEAARAVHGCGESDCPLCAALEPFTPAEEPAYVRYVKTYRASLDEGGLEFNERMQERERARRVAALGIELAPVAPAATVDTAVSDGLSSGTGGRSASLTDRGDLPHISPSGPAPPVDRRLEWWQREQAAATRTIVSLEDRLERAERERDESRVNGATLALRVTALVEALRQFAADDWDDDDWVRGMARAALAGWEQA